MTGVQTCALPISKAIFRAGNPSEELLKWLGFEKRGENDDRTIMVVYHKSLRTEKLKEITTAAEKGRDGSKVEAAKSSEKHSAHSSVLLALIMLGVIFLAILSFWAGYKFGKSESGTKYSASYHQGRDHLLRGFLNLASGSSLQPVPNI